MESYYKIFRSNAKHKYSRLVYTHKRYKKRTQNLMKHIGNKNKYLIKRLSYQEKSSDAYVSGIMSEAMGLMDVVCSIHEEALDK